MICHHALPPTPHLFPLEVPDPDNINLTDVAPGSLRRFFVQCPTTTDFQVGNTKTYVVLAY